MQDIHNLYLELQLELVKNFIAYIPTVLSENGLLEEIASEIKALHYIETNLSHKDKLLLFDSDINLIVSPNFEELKPFYAKNIELQKNNFKLIELSKTLSDESFDYLYHNYLNKLNGYINASGFLVDNFESNCPQDLQPKRTLFVIQNELFINHLNELQKTIDFIYNYDLDENSLENNIPETNKENSTELNNIKTKKSPLSKKDALDYLLASVFKAKK
ncbi:hypothetical protein [Flavobacterium aquatile]|uniref:Uncharacterized protein n=1 Tax=Flavobacterium aquatile LMG 4008 = ATCC 11947 TaxID=1453498 RepID=A0A095SY56_9FLAO|nr:hypothetical protein [Flavobacterium aquatile]KGD69586.1 hypothetical protein LG45_02160 [Flavobacterium aquatile LMG 4008 = ATCC 11947]OXA67279.1 hypothetical protein B0A61_08720 [Flavobacterium aquatile LMG 4008 = ATCC 11947]GEC77938.1 hypothetical protein FAQ01_08080 [Flavobacterium aquatile]